MGQAQDMLGRYRLEYGRRVGLFLLLLLLSACAGSETQTEVLLVVDSDLAIDDELTAVVVKVYDRAGKDKLREQRLTLTKDPEVAAKGSRYLLPLSLSLVAPSQDSTRSFRVVVTGLGPVAGESDKQVIEQQAIVGFRPRARGRLDIFLGARCSGELCRDGDDLEDLTCDPSDGGCVAIRELNSLPKAKGDGLMDFTLPDGVVRRHDGGMDSGMDGGASDSGTSPATCKPSEVPDGNGGCKLAEICADSSQHNCDTDPLACVPGVMQGTFVCACPDGYKGNGLGESGCADINECEAATAVCDIDPLATCKNTQGSFECTCPSGYMGNGRGANGCKDVLECDIDNGGCDLLTKCNEVIGGPPTCGAGAGLSVELLSATIDPDNHAVVTVKVMDADGFGIDKDGLQTVGAVAPRFTLAYLKSDGSGFMSYLLAPQVSPITNVTAQQPTSDQDGDWARLGVGTYSYRFSTPLPDDFDPALTHRVATWATRTVDQVTYSADAFIDFRPDGDTDLQTRQVSSTDTCNQCHNPLATHGGQRLSLELCSTCHTSQGIDPDTGNSIDLKAMIHKIHRGAELPSVKAGKPYQLIGFRQLIRDYSEVVFPHEINFCPTCHTGQDAAVWSDNPSVEACGSCHDDIDFTLTENTTSGSLRAHTGGPKDNSACAACHGIGGIPGLSIQQSHQRGKLNPNTPTLTAEILSVTNTASTDAPVIEFRVLVDGSPRDLPLEPIETLRFLLAGPTTDVAGWRAYTVAQDTDLTPTSGGAYRFTLPETLQTATSRFTPTAVAAVGSFLLMAEGRETFDVQLDEPFTVDKESVRVGFKNPVATISLSGTATVPRRPVVSDAKCNRCHRQLESHGGNRNTVEACVFCHTGALDHIGGMPQPPSGETVAIPNLRFGPMIHRIHSSEVAQAPFVLYSLGFPLDFSNVAFPGSSQDCDTCHIADAYDLPLTRNLAPSVLRVQDDSGTIVSTTTVGPTTAACNSCHDSPEALAHAQSTNTQSGSETCAACHAVGQVSAVDEVHARPQWQ